MPYTSENDKPNKSLAFVFKEDGLRYMFLISSNAYKDRAKDIVCQKALESYTKNFQPGGENTRLEFWHGGDAIGEVIESRMFGPFLVEVARELPNATIDLAREGKEPPYPTTIKKVWDIIVKGNIDWGASIGFRARKSEALNGIFKEVLIFERSILPRIAAANAITISKVLKE